MGYFSEFTWREAMGINKIIPGMPEGVTMRDGYASRVCSK